MSKRISIRFQITTPNGEILKKGRVSLGTQTSTDEVFMEIAGKGARLGFGLDHLKFTVKTLGCTLTLAHDMDVVRVEPQLFICDGFDLVASWLYSKGAK
jgi:hypothetical protein